ncbi:MAG: OmpA family protein [Oscillospiraceae bacterium]|jgi:outer membrane protein OmpA-like peptidoglycan-associated protein
MMKACRKTLILLLVFAFALAAGCAGEPKPAQESGSVVVVTPETTEGPVETKDPEIEGEPERVWQYKYEGEDRDITIDSIATFGEFVATGQFCVSYIHHLSDGTLIDAFPHKHTVEDMEFSPDGSVLGAGLGVWGVDLTELSDGAEPKTLGKGHNSCLAFSPDGQHIVTGNRDGILWIWELDSFTQTDALENPDLENKKVMEKTLIAIDYHPSGKLLAATHWTDGTIYIWDMEKKEVIQSLQADTVHGTNVFRFSPNGNEMACAVMHGFDEYLIQLLTVDKGEGIHDIVIPAKRINDLNFSPDGSLLAVASLGSPITIWDVASGKLLYTLDQEIAPLENTPYLDNAPDKVTFTDDGGHLAVASKWAGTLELWRLPGAEPIAPPPVDMRTPPPLPGDVLFDTGSAELKQEAFVELEAFAEELYANFTKATITFIGHTDSRGDAQSNLQLSIDRAQAIKDWFQNWADKKGYSEWVLLIDGKGVTELKVPDVDVEGNFMNDAGALNRRVEIEIEL